MIDVKCPVDPLRKLMRIDHCAIHLHHSSLEDLVTVHGGVIACNKALLNVGDCVATTDPLVKYGVLLACYKVEASKAVCLVRELKQILSDNMEPILNQYDCPLLMLTEHIFDILVSDLISSISAVHMCTDSCIVIEENSSRVFEREKIDANRTIFKHDWTNHMYFETDLKKKLHHTYRIRNDVSEIFLICARVIAANM